ncbi:MAG: ferritin-like domain-containing protein [Deltaproteobacteria bacterium]|nr:ferritin-like domain-containing protein [Deltaproteobacteria bacterium]
MAGRDLEVDLGDLSFGEGAHLLVDRALRRASAARSIVRVRGTGASWRLDLDAWARAHGHSVTHESEAAIVVATPHGSGVATERAGLARATDPGAVHDAPPLRWGLAARGAQVEANAPEIPFLLASKRMVWADEAARLYAQAVAQQWDPAIAIPWNDPTELPDEVEDAVVSVMTYLVENETAALLVPARFLSQIHPHFREVMQLLAITAADEARHVEVFARRASLRRGGEIGRSTASGQRSLSTLLIEPDFATASFLLSVLGEGTFLDLLWFLRDHAPDPVTAEVVRLAAQDEARHVAFGLAHLSRHASEDSGLHARLAAAVERRHANLGDEGGLDPGVLDALVLLAAGSWEHDAIRRGHAAVVELVRRMDDGRQQRLRRLGFDATEAETLSSLHTRNFM